MSYIVLNLLHHESIVEKGASDLHMGDLHATQFILKNFQSPATWLNWFVDVSRNLAATQTADGLANALCRR